MKLRHYLLVALPILAALFSGGSLLLLQDRLPPRTISMVAEAAPIGGPFSLVDHTGRKVADKDFLGAYALVFFGYTHCPDVCPTTLQEVAVVMNELGERSSRVRPLFISIDPERDTPEVLADYVSFFHPRIVGLTGTAEQVAGATEAFRVTHAKAEIDEDFYLMDHSSALYLMGPDGRYLTAFSHTTPPEEMAARIRGYIDG